MPYHENPRPAFPPPTEWGAIERAWEALRDADFADEGGPLKNRHEFLQIGELIEALRTELAEFGSEAHEIMPRYI